MTEHCPDHNYLVQTVGSISAIGAACFVFFRMGDAEWIMVLALLVLDVLYAVVVVKNYSRR